MKKGTDWTQLFTILILALFGTVVLVQFSLAQGTDLDPPVIHGPTVGRPIENVEVTAKIDLGTNEECTGVLRYGTSTGNYTSELPLVSTYQGLRHNATIEHLYYDQAYYFIVEVIDMAGNVTTSDEQSFTTPKKGIVIEQSEFSTIDPTQAVLDVETNKDVYLEIHYGSVSGTLPNRTGAARGPSGSVVNSVNFTDLRPDTSYYYTITARVPQTWWDLIELEEDRILTTEERSFHTPAESVDDAETEATISDQANYLQSGYGCTFSTSLSDTNHLKVANLFVADSRTDQYLADVFEAYTSVWDRVPRCDEMQFHLDHSTPIERLTAWLEATPSETEADLPSAPVVQKATSAEHAMEPSESFVFNPNEAITFTGTTIPNGVVKLAFSSEPFSASVTADENGAWSYTLMKDLGEGQHTLQVSVVDANGAESEQSAPFTFTVSGAEAMAKDNNVTQTDNTLAWWLGGGALGILLLAFLFRKQLA